MTVIGSRPTGDRHNQRDDNRGFSVDPRAIPRRLGDQGTFALACALRRATFPNFVDLQSGGWGATIQDPLNSSQTPTMANFATLADVIAGCVTSVTPDACPEALRSDHTAKG